MPLRRLLSGVIIATALMGCQSSLPLFPIPVLSMAPKTPLLPETGLEQFALDAASGEKPRQRPARPSPLAMRGGRACAVTARTADEGLFAGLPVPVAGARPELSRPYVSPPRFRPPQSGDWHYYNFAVSDAFARANALYLHGDAEGALAATEQIFAQAARDKQSEDASPKLLWQASFLRVYIHIMTGRADLAEAETKRTEALEIEAMQSNIASRAMRAEARYWGGDIEGAGRDAAQVIKALGDWRFPASYSSPPRDQTELALGTVAQVRANIIFGWVLIHKGFYREALGWMELAEQTMNNVMYVHRHPLYGLYFPAYQEILYGRGMALAGLGTVLVILDADAALADAMFSRAMEYFDRMGFLAGQVLVHTFRAQGLALAGRHGEAQAQAQKGLVLAEQAELLDYVWRLEIIRGQAQRALGDREAAETALRRAQAVVDLIAGTMTSDESKIRFGIGKEQITELLVAIDLEKNDAARLFEDLERGRARAFVAMLANRTVAGGKQDARVKEIRALDQEILKERRKKNALSAAAIAGGNETALLRQRQELVRQLRGAAPDLADVFQVSASSLADVQAALLPGEALVYYIALPGAGPLCQLVVTSRSAQIETLHLSVEGLKALIGAFTRSLATPDRGAQNAFLARMEQGLRVGDWKGHRRIYLVPSGPVHFVPWGGLSLSVPVAVLPTGGWIARQASVRMPETTTAVVLGDPEFGRVVEQLPGARAEAEAVARLYNTPALVGPAATEPLLRQRVGDGADVLHLATHALYDPVSPLKSALLLSDGKSAAPLTAEVLYERPLPATLVVLSACETGMGQVAAGDDLLGLVRSFYLGGTRMLVSSLWPVSDEATRLYMDTFHKEARRGDIGQAWLAARDRLKNDGFGPAEYAPFVLGGSFGGAGFLQIHQRTGQ